MHKYDETISGSQLIAALELSTKTPDQLAALLGTKSDPKKFSGPAASGEQVHTWKTQFDQGTGRVTFTDTDGAIISGRPADVEKLLVGIVTTAIEAQIIDGGHIQA